MNNNDTSSTYEMITTLGDVFKDSIYVSKIGKLQILSGSAYFDSVTIEEWGAKSYGYIPNRNLVASREFMAPMLSDVYNEAGNQRLLFALYNDENNIRIKIINRKSMSVSFTRIGPVYLCIPYIVY